jgi:hypothetical protein
VDEVYAATLAAAQEVEEALEAILEGVRPLLLSLQPKEVAEEEALLRAEVLVLLELHQRPHLKEVAEDEALLRAEVLVLLELHQRPHLKEVAEEEALLKAEAMALLAFLPQLLLLLLLLLLLRVHLLLPPLLRVHQGMIHPFLMLV